ncbi:hypothetical protein [Paenibacillus amylolyticus]|uniref:hypothetical protein n=1 Tax=Paenibacillus amylolyticus TaxID=1451 RepID=UPI000FDBA299|nr:hypothetical protein [Paenibacillus amylolyticus]
MIGITHPRLNQLAERHYEEFFVKGLFESELEHCATHFTHPKFRAFFQHLYNRRKNILIGDPEQLQYELDTISLNPELNQIREIFEYKIDTDKGKKKIEKMKLAIEKLLVETMRTGDTSEHQNLKEQYDILNSAFDFIKAFNSIFNYSKFLAKGNDPDWGPYYLLNQLKICVCPYCNRNYTTVLAPDQDRRGTKAQFDHFYSKSQHPYFSVSFYNLIPSCSTCNADIKYTTNFTSKTHLSPYEEGFGDKVKFTVQFPTAKEKKDYLGLWSQSDQDLDFNISVLFNKGLVKGDGTFIRKATRNLRDLRIVELYNTHKDYVVELIAKEQAYKKDYIYSLYMQFPHIFHSREDVTRFLSANYVAEGELSMRPLAKLTRDISQEFGML